MPQSGLSVSLNVFCPHNIALFLSLFGACHGMRWHAMASRGMRWLAMASQKKPQLVYLRLSRCSYHGFQMHALASHIAMQSQAAARAREAVASHRIPQPVT